MQSFRLKIKIDMFAIICYFGRRRLWLEDVSVNRSENHRPYSMSVYLFSTGREFGGFSKYRYITQKTHDVTWVLNMNRVKVRTKEKVKFFNFNWTSTVIAFVLGSQKSQSITYRDPTDTSQWVADSLCNSDVRTCYARNFNGPTRRTTRNYNRDQLWRARAMGQHALPLVNAIVRRKPI